MTIHGSIAFIIYVVFLLPCVFGFTSPCFVPGLRNGHIANLGVVVKTNAEGQDPSVNSCVQDLAEDRDQIER